MEELRMLEADEKAASEDVNGNDNAYKKITPKDPKNTHLSILHKDWDMQIWRGMQVCSHTIINIILRPDIITYHITIKQP
eukprot:8363855-Prorocentrum_lima.AAC.1